jgi:predicted regulator of Ras-like GTPase activity (Roadblock/LC7/MglB family)
MMDALPPGEVMGDMQAPLSWVLSHTSNFSGVVRLKNRSGEGFILIERRPSFWYFKAGNKVMTGTEAEMFLKDTGVLRFRLHRYTPAEMIEAQRICRGGSRSSVIPGPAPDIPLDKMNGTPVIPVAPQQAKEEGGVVSGHTSRIELESYTYTDDPDFDVIQRFLRRPEIKAAAIFKDGLSSGSVAEINIDKIVSRTRDALQLIHWFGSVIQMGDFLSLTIQTARHYIIVRRYDAGHLLIIATSSLPLGQIRTILREIEGDEDGG